ncbi:MAG: hypothetical protein AAF288_01725 [Planctomycetota bacterium]
MTHPDSPAVSPADAARPRFAGRFASPALALSLAIVLAVTAALAAVRVLGPSDLHAYDQPKTAAYSVDIANHGRWVLPRDMLGRPATKPPMVNWIGAAFGSTFGWNALTLRAPSILAGLVVAGLTWLAATKVFNQQELWVESEGPAHPARFWFPTLAGVMVVASPLGLKQLALIRPDMVLCACLTAGWLAATALLLPPEDDPNKPKPWARQRALQTTLWLCVAGAALAKGPPALLLIAYVVLGGKLLAGRWSAALRTGVLWGLPLALGLVGLWLYGVHRANPTHLRETLWGAEIANRVSGSGQRGNSGGGGGFVNTLVEFPWKMPLYGLTRFLPWSVLAILALNKLGSPKKWFRHPLAPAVLWALVILVFFSLSSKKRADYALPLGPAVAILASWWLAIAAPREVAALTARRAAVAVFAVATLLGGLRLMGGSETDSGAGDALQAFAQAIRQNADDAPIAFLDGGYHPLQSLLGRNQAGPASDDLKNTAPWRIVRIETGPNSPPPRPNPRWTTAAQTPELRDDDLFDGRPGRLVLLRRAAPPPTAP